MITQSKHYAAVENGIVVAKGSAKAVRRIVRALQKAQRLTGYPVTAQVWDSPSSVVAVVPSGAWKNNPKSRPWP